MYSEGSQFVTKFLSVLKLVIYKIYFWHQSDFRFVFTKACQMLIQNNIYCWIETTRIEIKESRQSKFYNNIVDLSIRSFWYHNSDTKRNPWVMLYSYCPINDSSGYLHNTVYLAVMLQASWHTAEGNQESKGLYIKSWWIGKTS